MRLIYLDQNHWITLARVAHRRIQDSVLEAVLDFVRAAGSTGAARFPLSLGHYLEIQKRGELGSRERLGKIMFGLSGGYTLAPYAVIVRHEIEVSLSFEFPGRVDIGTFQLLGRGVGHAFGKDARIRLTPPPGVNVPPERLLQLEAFANREFELSVLTGWSPFLQEAPRPFDTSVHEQRFNDYLRELRNKWATIKDEDMRRRFLLATSLLDVFDDVGEVLRVNQLDGEEFMRLGEDGITRFLSRMPSRRLDMHLRRCVASDSSLPIKSGDLIDWAQTGLAAMYCDVVVAERLLTGLLTRPGITTRASVISELRRLPAA